MILHSKSGETISQRLFNHLASFVFQCFNEKRKKFKNKTIQFKKKKFKGVISVGLSNHFFPFEKWI